LLSRAAGERGAEERVADLQLLELGERVAPAGRDAGRPTGSTAPADGHDVDILLTW
jgi:hypothetical protein